VAVYAIMVATALLTGNHLREFRYTEGKTAAFARSASMGSSKRRLRALTKIPDQMAIRVAAGQEERAVAALESFGEIEEQTASRVFILHLDRGVAAPLVRPTIESLRRAHVVEFTSPVLRDEESGIRQVPTDEIILRLKRGHATQRTLRTLSAEHDFEVARRNEFEPTQYIVRLKKPSGTETLKVARSLDQRADVEFASPNFLTGIKKG
jgi:hypothetical protein